MVDRLLGGRSPENDDQSCLKTVSGIFANDRCPETSPWSEWGARGPLARGQGVGFLAGGAGAGATRAAVRRRTFQTAALPSPGKAGGGRSALQER